MKLMIMASHPVPYHVPVFRRISQIFQEKASQCVVVYLSDFSTKAFLDKDFKSLVAWDEPLLEGYRSIVLHSTKKRPQNAFWQLKAHKIKEVILSEKPDKILFTSLNYLGDFKTLIIARLMGISCVLRSETTDVAMRRSYAKSLFRSTFYSLLYGLFDSAIAIGSQNQSHFLNHGFPKEKVDIAYYTVPNEFKRLSLQEKNNMRTRVRGELGIGGQQTVLLFCGKLISKKAPETILQALANFSAADQKRFTVLFVGSGPLEDDLQKMARSMSCGTQFLGFKNTGEIPQYYLGADLFVLPSRQLGETWGLVVNEALQAGLPCFLSEAVGCSKDFAAFPGVSLFQPDDVQGLTRLLREFQTPKRCFDAYDSLLKPFSEEFVSKKIAESLFWGS